MADSDELYTGTEVDDDLSSAIGTETLADRDLIPPGLRQSPQSPDRRLAIEIFANQGDVLEVHNSISWWRDHQPSAVQKNC